MCGTYEVAMSVPLHDFKNLITHILEELLHQISDTALKQEITAFTKKALGNQLMNIMRLIASLSGIHFIV